MEFLREKRKLIIGLILLSFILTFLFPLVIAVLTQK